MVGASLCLSYIYLLPFIVIGYKQYTETGSSMSLCLGFNQVLCTVGQMEGGVGVGEDLLYLAYNCSITPLKVEMGVSLPCP